VGFLATAKLNASPKPQLLIAVITVVHRNALRAQGRDDDRASRHVQIVVAYGELIGGRIGTAFTASLAWS
jgi:hypothetical protein